MNIEVLYDMLDSTQSTVNEIRSVIKFNTAYN
jgi:hypothetical protein